MSNEDRIEATLKNIEGKVQEAVGEFTGDPKDQAEGQVKQAEAEAQHTVENAKDEIRENL